LRLAVRGAAGSAAGLISASHFYFALL
jgi:hypothetical protein